MASLTQFGVTLTNASLENGIRVYLESMTTTNLLEAKEKGVTKAVKDVDRLPLAIEHLMKVQHKSERAIAESYGVSYHAINLWRKGKCPKNLFVLLELLYTDENLS